MKRIQKKTVELSPEQAGRIREITAITSSLLITLLIEKQVTAVHLVGRKINNREWAGSLATWPDTPAVAPTQAQELSFAEQIVSEATQSLRYWIVGEKSVDLIGYAKSTRA